MKKILSNILVMLISTVVALVIGEVILRFVYKKLPQENWGTIAFCRNQDYNMRFMVPNVSVNMFSEEFSNIKVTANSKGYRDTEWKDKKGKKIMVLGDSFGWGWGCNYGDMITQKIDSMLGDSASTYNICIPGHDLSDIYDKYRYYAPIIKPDYVLILNYINDFHNIPTQIQKVAEKDTTLYTNFDGNIGCTYHYEKGLRDYINEYSYIYRLINRVRSMGGISFSSKQKVANMMKKGYQKDIDLFKSDEQLDAAFNFYTPLLEEMAENSKVVVVNIPAIYEVQKSKNEQIQEFFGKELNYDKLNEKFATEYNDSASRVTFIDILEVLKQQEKEVYFQHDSHLNSYGQGVTGTYIGNYFKNDLL